MLVEVMLRTTDSLLPSTLASLVPSALNNAIFFGIVALLKFVL